MRSGFASVHNQAYWAGADYLGIGPSAFSTFGPRRWQNLCDYRAYIDCILLGRSPIGSAENLTPEMKRTERVALSLRTREGVSAVELKYFAQKANEFVALGLLRQSNGNFVLTEKGKYATVFKKQADGSWRAVADINNADAPAAAAPCGTGRPAPAPPCQEARTH